MLPDIDADDGDVRQERILVGSGGDLEDLQGGVVALSHTKTDDWYASMEDRTRQGTHEPAPAGALDGSGRRVELGDELVDGAPGLDDGLLEGAVAEDTAVALALRRGACEVLPEEGVVDVTCDAAQSVSILLLS